MTSFSDELIDAMGGTTKVASFTKAPPSTVQSWRKKLTPSRLDHLRRIIAAEGLEVDVHGIARRFDVTLETDGHHGEDAASAGPHAPSGDEGHLAGSAAQMERAA